MGALPSKLSNEITRVSLGRSGFQPLSGRARRGQETLFPLAVEQGEEDAFEVAGFLGLLSEVIDGAAGDQPAVIDDADPVGDLFDNGERVG